MSADLKILPEVREFVEVHKIGRVEGETVSSCAASSLRPFEPPSNIVGDTLGYIRPLR